MIFKTALTFAFVLLSSASLLNAKIMGKEITYQQGETVLKGYISFDDSVRGERPGILVVHEWWGHNAYARVRADMLAKQGYVALAVDMYGEGKTADHPKDAEAFAQAVFSDLTTAEMRFDAALKTLRDHPACDEDKVAAIGYCFGGGIVLNMALMGADVQGVASFHGSLPQSDPAPADDTRAAILVCNGADDPMVTPEQIETFKSLCKEQDITLTFENYEGAMHSFTNPQANEFAEEFDLPLAYKAEADKQSWMDLLDFLRRVFGEGR